MRKEVEASLKTFDISLKNSQKEVNSFISTSVKAIRQKTCDVGLLDSFEKKRKIFKDCFTLIKRSGENFRQTEVVDNN